MDLEAQRSGRHTQKDLNQDEIKERFYRDIILRKKIGSPTEEQIKAILANEDNISVIAGAGTGKTTTIKYLFPYLVLFKDVHPEKICCLAYNFKAKEDLKKDIRTVLSEYSIKADYNKLQIFTFHGKSYRNIKKDDKKVISDKVDDQYPTIKPKEIYLEVSKKLGLKDWNFLEVYYEDFEMIERVKKAKNLTSLDKWYIEESKRKFRKDFELIRDYIQQYEEDTNELREYINKKIRKQVYKNRAFLWLDFFETYQSVKKRWDCIDFNDMLVDFKKKLSNLNEREMQVLHKNHMYLIVDEFQDMNSLHHYIINKLIGKNSNLVVVGDPRQSIYGYNGAQVEHIIDFVKKRNNANEYNLTVNFRCPPKILSYSNEFIKWMGYPDMQKCEKSKDVDKLKIPCFRLPDEAEENNFWSNVIIKLLTENYYSPEDILILSRTNKKLRDLAKVLKKYLDQNSIKHIFYRKNIDIPKLLVKDEYSQPEDLEKNCLNFLSIHSSKGLEAPVIILLGMNRGLSPNTYPEYIKKIVMRKNKYKQDDEENRLFYVAITRAKELLLMSCSLVINENLRDTSDFVVNYPKHTEIVDLDSYEDSKEVHEKYMNPELYNNVKNKKEIITRKKRAYEPKGKPELIDEDTDKSEFLSKLMERSMWEFKLEQIREQNREMYDLMGESHAFGKDQDDDMENYD